MLDPSLAATIDYMLACGFRITSENRADEGIYPWRSGESVINLPLRDDHPQAAALLRQAHEHLGAENIHTYTAERETLAPVVTFIETGLAALRWPEVVQHVIHNGNGALRIVRDPNTPAHLGLFVESFGNNFLLCEMRPGVQSDHNLEGVDEIEIAMCESPSQAAQAVLAHLFSYRIHSSFTVVAEPVNAQRREIEARERTTPILTVGDVEDLLAQTIAGDGEAPELERMIYPGDASTWLQDLIATEAAAYHDDYSDPELDPEAAFRARRRLRSLHLALGLVKLLDERM